MVIMTVFQISSVVETVQNELPQFVKNKSLLPEIDNYFYKAYKQEQLTDRDRASMELAPKIWLYACLVDAAQNDSAYPAEKYQCEKEWEAAVRFLKYELGKRKLFSGILMNDVMGLCERGAASLKSVGAGACGPGLSIWVRDHDESLSDLYDSLISLEKRLLDAAEKAKPWQS